MRAIKVGDRFGRLVVIKKISKGRSLLHCDCVFVVLCQV